MKKIKILWRKSLRKMMESLVVLIKEKQQYVFNDYITKGNTYKYTFTQEGETFSLSKIELVKETSN